MYNNLLQANHLNVLSPPLVSSLYVDTRTRILLMKETKQGHPVVKTFIYFIREFMNTRFFIVQLVALGCNQSQLEDGI